MPACIYLKFKQIISLNIALPEIWKQALQEKNMDEFLAFILQFPLGDTLLKAYRRFSSTV